MPSDAPPPYVPEDGAIICQSSELPTDGTWECRIVPGAWMDVRHYNGIVEARPIREPDVTIVLPRDVVRKIAIWSVGGTQTELRDVIRACRTTLAKEDDA